MAYSRRVQTRDCIIKVAHRLANAFRQRFLSPLRGRAARAIPAVMVTGSVGKSTTCRMVARILQAAGHTVGLATTDDIRIGGAVVRRGDSAGYHGAARVLSDPQATAAVLETARGDLLQRGVYIRPCDVGALLNVRDEQLGLDGVDTIAAMGRLKQAVPKTARVAVLSAEDAYCQTIVPAFDPARLVLFAVDDNIDTAQRHRAAGQRLLGLSSSAGGECIALRRAGRTDPIVETACLPALHGGIARHNLENLLAAAAIGVALDQPLSDIASGLRRFTTSVAESPGRFNLISGFPFPVVLDKGASIPAVSAIADAAGRMNVPGRRICAFTARGNRPDSHFAEIAACIAPRFDELVCYEAEPFLRGRSAGEILKHLTDGLCAAGKPPQTIRAATGYREMVAALAALAGPGDLVVILGGLVHDVLPALEHELRPRARMPSAAPVPDKT